MLSAKMFVYAGYAYLKIVLQVMLKKGVSMALIETVSLLDLGISFWLYSKALLSIQYP